MDYLQYLTRVNLDNPKAKVLNLIINGLPSIWKKVDKNGYFNMAKVLNLIINGLPSILP